MATKRIFGFATGNGGRLIEKRLLSSSCYRSSERGLCPSLSISMCCGHNHIHILNRGLVKDVPWLGIQKNV